MPFKETPQGTTHHDKDACRKCKVCEQHFFIESHLYRHVCVDKETLKAWSEDGERMRDITSKILKNEETTQ